MGLKYDLRFGIYKRMVVDALVATCDLRLGLSVNLSKCMGGCCIDLLDVTPNH